MFKPFSFCTKCFYSIDTTNSRVIGPACLATSSACVNTSFSDIGFQTTLRPPTLQEATNAALKEHGGISGKMALVDRISAHKEMAKAIFHELTKPGFNAS